MRGVALNSDWTEAMTKNSAKKRAARDYQAAHPGTTFPAALRAIESPATAADYIAAPASAETEHFTEPRRLADNRLREQRAQRARSSKQVAPINALVDKIGVEQSVTNMPLIDPTFGGINATVLFVLKAPEADANPNLSGPRLLSLDNDDDTAQDMFRLTAETGLDRSSITAWNVCPFPAEGKNPTAAEVKRSARYHSELFSLLPHLQVIVLFGDDAKRHWKHVPYPGSARVLDCHLPSRWNRPGKDGVPRDRDSWVGIQSTLAEAAKLVDG
ncbi:uracil-DNA glycosylase family protein [Rhodococcus koreensis]|uniref:hypothetical protein n=1 Tax=Rhodococcus koreensis TaxID=99653 RepID=UPI0036DEE445